MNIKLKKVLVSLLAVSMTWIPVVNFSVPASAATTPDAINLASKNQVIRGFGAASAWCGALSDSRMDTLFSNAGLSILRLRIAPNEGWNKGNYSAWADELSNAKKAAARGAIVFATPWTPPASMKDNNSVNHGSLKSSSYGDYANYLKTFVKYLSDNGVKLYGISLQNEPDWNPDYEGCVWTASQFDTFIRSYGATISSVTRIIMPESLGFNQALSDPTLNDASACPYVSIVGGHLYGATIKDYPLARSKGKDIWMTEHLLDDQGISACLDTAKEINDCMTIGNMNAYVWWWVNSDSCGFFNTSGVVQKRLFVEGQYSKFIRNGYTRVSAASNPQSNVYVSAYTGDGKVVIVATNKGTSAVSQSFSLQNGSTSSVSSWVTSSSLNMAKSSSDIGVSNGNFTANLPAQSVTTFVGTLGGSVVTTPTPTQKPVVTPTSAPIVTPTPTTKPIVTPTLVPTQSGIEVAYTIASSWNGGASVNVTIKNNGTAPINGWKLSWTLPTNQSITSIWSGSSTVSGGIVTVTNASYNGTIAANGGTQSFGFNLNCSGTPSKPTAFKLNGISCTVK